MARELITGKGRRGSGDQLRQLLEDPVSQCPLHPVLLTIVVPLAEQLQEAEQVLCEFIICHDLLSWVGGKGRSPGRVRCAKTKHTHAHNPCTLHTHARWGAGRSSHYFKDTLKATSTQETSETVDGCPRSPGSEAGASSVFLHQCPSNVTTHVTSRSDPADIEQLV